MASKKNVQRKNKILAIKSAFELSAVEIKDMIGAKSVKAFADKDEIASILRSAIRIYEEEEKIEQADYAFFEVTGDVYVTVLLLKYDNFGFALNLSPKQIGELALATDTIGFVDSIRLHQHMSLKQHQILHHILTSRGMPTKTIESDGTRMEKIRSSYGQRLVLTAYKVIVDALDNKWEST